MSSELRRPGGSHRSVTGSTRTWRRMCLALALATIAASDSPSDTGDAGGGDVVALPIEDASHLGWMP